MSINLLIRHGARLLLYSLLWCGLLLGLHAQNITALQIEGVTPFYDQPYLLDFNLVLRDQNDRAVVTDPTNLTVVCKEDGAPISASETGFRLLAAANKQLQCFLVLDYTLSMADPAINGDSNGDGISDAIEAMQGAAKALIGTVNTDAQIGLYEFHREDAGHPPQKVSDLTVNKAALSNHIDRVWTDHVQFFPAGTRVWDAVYATSKPITVQRVPLAEGGVCPDNWVFEHTVAAGWVELRSPNPQNIFTALGFATQGKLVRFTLTGVTDLSTCFSNFSVDNTIYTAGGQSFVILNTSLVGRQAQTIAFGPLADRLLSTPSFTVSATASSSLPVTFTVVSGPATINGTTVTLTGTGRVTIRAEQAGNDVYGSAVAEHSFQVYATLPHNTPIGWLGRYGWAQDPVQGEAMDLDGDGLAMWQEYVAGTDPTKRDSVFAIQRVRPGADGWQITFSTESNRVYQVEYAAAFLGAWQALQTGIPGDGQLKSVTDPTQSGQRFYRVGITSFPNPPPQVAGMVWIEPGTFVMGSPATEQGRDSDEGPQTTVTISRGFWLGQYEVTQREYLAVMGNNPSSFTEDLNRPVEGVSWYDATNYCGKLTGQERQAGRLPDGYEYRLPTEAQWEYACRAGTTTRFSHGDDVGYTQLGQYAWYSGNSSSQTHAVGQRAANPWGLYDMHGNVWEWCADWYGSYPGGSVPDPTGSSGSYRVLRGGSWTTFGRNCRSAIRVSFNPSYRVSNLGFRFALVFNCTDSR